MKKVGLALGSGGSRGLAHIGVIKCLVENKIPIDYIAGTSAGSLIGGLYAAYQDISKIESIINTVDYKKMIEILFDPFTAQGLVKGDKLEKFLNQYLKNQKIEKLSIPFRAVATDILSGKSVVIKSGLLTSAIRSSCSIPVVFSPVITKNKILVDGAVSCPVPVEVVRKMGAKIIIAVDVYDSLYPNKQANILSTVDLMLHHLAKLNCLSANLVIRPPIPNINPLDFVQAKKIIDLGYCATQAQLPQIKKLISPWSILRW